MDNCTLLELITDFQRLPNSQAFVALPIPMTADSGGKKSDCYAKVMRKEVRKLVRGEKVIFCDIVRVF